MAKHQAATPAGAIPHLLPDGSLLSHAVFRDRMHFLRVVNRVAPEVLQHLRDEVHPIDDAAARSQALATWQEKFRISEPWILDAANETLRAWRDHDAPPHRGWHPTIIAAVVRFPVPKGSVVKLGSAVILPGDSPSKAVKFELLAAEDSVREKADQFGAELREVGWKPLRDPETDYAILAHWQYQENEWTLRRLADQYDFGELKTDRLEKRHTGISGVIKARDRAAKQIGLHVRAGKQGPHEGS